MAYPAQVVAAGTIVERPGLQLWHIGHVQHGRRLGATSRRTLVITTLAVTKLPFSTIS